MRLRSIVLTALLFSALSLTGCVATKQAADQAKAAPTAPTPKVQKLIDQHQLEIVGFEYVQAAVANGTRNGAKALLIDARPNGKYLVGTIPSSLNIPDTQIDKYIGQLDKVAKDKEIIVYCGGWACEKSPIVAGYLKNNGYTNVKLYQAGEPEWKKMSYIEVGIPVVESVIKKDSAVLMDARPRLKYLAETIPSSMYMLDTDLERLEGRFPADKNTPIITFCGGYACEKSHAVAHRLLELDYTNVRVFAGGLPAWKKAGLKTTASAKKAEAEDAAPAAPVFVDGIKAGVDEGTIDGEWFNALYQDGKVPANVAIIDVRGAEDYAVGHLKGAILVEAGHMTAEELAAKLPKDKVAVFVCGSGARAMEAYFKLKDAEVDVSKVMYFDANINCAGDKCEIEVNEPLG